MAERDFSNPIVYHVDGMRDVRVQRDVVYKRDGGAELEMNIYSPARLSGDARVPAVFFVHGGPIPEQFVPPTQWGVFVSYGELAAMMPRATRSKHLAIRVSGCSINSGRRRRVDAHTASSYSRWPR